MRKRVTVGHGLALDAVTQGGELMAGVSVEKNGVELVLRNRYCEIVFDLEKGSWSGRDSATDTQAFKKL